MNKGKTELTKEKATEQAKILAKAATQALNKPSCKELKETILKLAAEYMSKNNIEFTEENCTNIMAEAVTAMVTTMLMSNPSILEKIPDKESRIAG